MTETDDSAVSVTVAETAHSEALVVYLAGELGLSAITAYTDNR